MRNRSQKNAETLLLEPTKNKEKKLPQARQTFAQRKTWKPASHQTKPMKNVLGTRMRKSRTPAGFVPKPLRNCSRKNPETSLLEPTKNKEIVPKPCKTAARKMPKRCFWNLLKTKKKSCLKVFGTRMRKSRTPAGFVPKPLRNCSRKNAETSLLEPTKNKEIVPKPCETAARKMPKRCFWNLLKTKKKVASSSQKNAETLLLEPTKNKEKKLPQARQTFAQRKTWKPASHQTKPMKNVLGTRMRKSRTPASFVPKPLRNCSLKNPETLFLESTKKTFETHKKQCFGNRCRQPSRKACARCLWRSEAVPTGSHSERSPMEGRHRQVPHRSTTIFCNNFLGALPLTATRGRRIPSVKSMAIPAWKISIPTTKPDRGGSCG